MTVCAHCASSCLPTAVEPVNDSLRERPSRMSGVITAAGSTVVTTLTTPAGSPDSDSTSASANIESGVCSAGFTTLVQPAASAGAILRAPMAIGKFHGVMSRLGPTGCLVTRNREPPVGAGR